MTIFSVTVLLLCSLPAAVLIAWWVLAKNDAPVDMHGLNAILAAREETEERERRGGSRVAYWPPTRASGPEFWEGTGRTQDSGERLQRR
jgi:hypothetical protein